MTHNEARDIIIALFRATWNDTTYPVAYDNASFTPPGSLGAWARLSVQFFDGDGRAKFSRGRATRCRDLGRDAARAGRRPYI